MLNPYSRALVLHELRAIDPQLELAQFEPLPAPREGYGSVRCLVCSQVVPLSSDETLPDGGLENGFGSLRNFKNHLEATRHIVARRAHSNSTRATAAKDTSADTLSSSQGSASMSKPNRSIGADSIDLNSAINSSFSSSLSKPKRRHTSATLASDTDESDLEVVPTSSFSAAKSASAPKRPRISEIGLIDPAVIAKLDAEVSDLAQRNKAGKLTRLQLTEERLELKSRARALGVDWDKQYAALFYPAGSAPTATSTPTGSTLARIAAAGGSMPTPPSRPRDHPFRNLTSASSSSPKSTEKGKSTSQRTAKENLTALEAARERLKEKRFKKKDEMQGIKRDAIVVRDSYDSPTRSQALPAGPSAARIMPFASSAPNMPGGYPTTSGSQSTPKPAIVSPVPGPSIPRRPGPFVPNVNDYSSVKAYDSPEASTASSSQPSSSAYSSSPPVAAPPIKSYGLPVATTSQRPYVRPGLSDTVRDMLIEVNKHRYTVQPIHPPPPVPALPAPAPNAALTPTTAETFQNLATMAAHRHWRPDEDVVDQTLDRLSISQMNMDRWEANQDDPEFRVNQQDIADWFAQQTSETRKSATVQEAAKKLGLGSETTQLPGFKKALLGFQIVSVAWMHEQEEKKIAGGINGDEMGLGKTVQILAVMASRRSNDDEIRSNLVVVPLSLLAQWEAEIDKFVEGFKVHIYHGSNPKKARKVEELQEYDVVLTTHATLANEWQDPDKEGPDHGILFQMCWYRIVIDEAHQIRNRATKVSRACIALDGVFRWALTGTPVINTLADYFPLFKFLRYRPWTSWQEFKDYVVKYEKTNPIEAGKRCNMIVDRVAIRRRKDDTIDGKLLVELGPKEIKMIEIPFMDNDERALYDQVEREAQVKVCKYLARGDLLKNMSNIFVLILRLRQICLHPTLIAIDGTGRFDREAEFRRAEMLIPADAIKRLLEDRLKIAIDREVIPDFEVENIDDECAVCFDPVLPLSVGGDGVVTPCGHVFCRACLIEILKAPTAQLDMGEEGYGYQASERPCPSCRTPFSEARLVELEAFEPDPDFVKREIERRAEELAKKKNKGKNKARAIIDDSEEEGGESGKDKLGRDVRSAMIVIDSDDEDLLPLPSTFPKDVKPKLEVDVNSDVKPDARPDVKPKIDDRKAKGKGKAKVESDDFFILLSDDDDDVKSQLKLKAKKESSRDVKPDSKPKISSNWMMLKAKKDPFRSPEKARPEAAPMRQAEDNDDPRALERQMADMIGGTSVLPSTKMRHVFKRLTEWKQEDPMIKTIVVSSFVSGLDVLDNFLRSRGIETIRFQGSSNPLERKEALRRLEEDPSVRVMLLSLKAGGVGLNLTSACRVISLDLAWSQSIELQAYDRVHRLGQLRNVLIERVVIEDTIEARILSLQQRKMLLSDLSLAEGQAKNGLAGIQIPELLGLFRLGVNGERLSKNAPVRPGGAPERELH